MTWQDSALCAQTDPEIFFPEKGGSTKDAKAVCGRCPVVAECLDYALANDERFGIWGGTVEHERRQMKQRTDGRPPLAFRTQAVHAHMAGVPVPELATQLGVSARTIYRWIEAA